MLTVTCTATILACTHCGSEEGVALEASHTLYEAPAKTVYDVLLEREPEDPNAPKPLCRSCAAEHHAFWDEQWAEYYRGLL